MIICTFCAVYYLLWYNGNINNVEYLNIDRNDVVDNDPAYNFFVRIGNWILIFTNFVPISLLVTLEMVKFI
jgi:phospholipid-transporting ATPase